MEQEQQQKRDLQADRSDSDDASDEAKHTLDNQPGSSSESQELSELSPSKAAHEAGAQGHAGLLRGGQGLPRSCKGAINSGRADALPDVRQAAAAPSRGKCCRQRERG
ncbi:hypothetical protein ON010_g12872 [Phytophthora cinnamomi]|nr:hypothetical protein ON010_g12872 [Phytophthora cinnamomi]